MKNKIEYLVGDFREKEMREFATMYMEMFLELGNIDFAIMADMIIEELSKL